MENKQKIVKAVWIDEQIMIRIKDKIRYKTSIRAYVERLLLKDLKKNEKSLS